MALLPVERSRAGRGRGRCWRGRRAREGRSVRRCASCQAGRGLQGLDGVRADHCPGSHRRKAERVVEPRRRPAQPPGQPEEHRDPPQLRLRGGRAVEVTQRHGLRREASPVLEWSTSRAASWSGGKSVASASRALNSCPRVRPCRASLWSRAALAVRVARTSCSSALLSAYSPMMASIRRPTSAAGLTQRQRRSSSSSPRSACVRAHQVGHAAHAGGEVGLRQAVQLVGRDGERRSVELNARQDRVLGARHPEGLGRGLPGSSPARPCRRRSARRMR